jgi:AAA15 family ATPase/GTPase
MITKIMVQNFKGIGEPIEVPLRPITLLFGKNSAGKSTILQAMLYVLEIIRTGTADVDRVQLGGEAINLGGFRNLVHKHDSSKRIRLQFDLQLDEFGLESYRLYDDMYEDIEDDALGNIKTAYIELEVSQVQDRAEITSYSVGLDSVLLASILRIGQYSAITNINMNHSLFSNEMTLCFKMF